MVLEFEGKRPVVHPTAYIAENATVVGDVVIEEEANIWFQSVVRGDTNFIRIGPRCNIQDGCILHVVKEFHPLILEDDVVLGHGVVVHGCRISRAALIGIGAIVLNGAEIGEESIVAAGSVVSPGTIIPPRSLAVGTPARVVRSLRDDDIRMIREIGAEYLELKERYSRGEG